MATMAAHASSNTYHQHKQEPYYELPPLPVSELSAFDASPFALPASTAATHEHAHAAAGEHTHTAATADASTSETESMLITRGRQLLEVFQRQKTASLEHTDDVRHVDAADARNDMRQVELHLQRLPSTNSSVSEHHESVNVRCIESWTELIAEQQQSAQMLDAIDAQLQQLHASVQQQTHSESVAVTALPLCTSLHQLLQRKRASELAVARFTAANAPLTTNAPADINDAQIRAVVDAECATLQRELADAQRTIGQIRSATATASTTGATLATARTDSTVDLTTMSADICAPPDDGRRHRVDDFATPLPTGWEMRATESGAVFFVHRQTNVTTWHDPRASIDSDDDEDENRVVHSSDTAADGRTEMQSQQQRIRIPSERKQAFGSYENTVTAATGHALDDAHAQYFDVVFKERGPIGIHFQANDPDGGATVRRLLPGTAAVETGILRPFDQLVAVNQHPVDAASFRHVMILLQGGLRPLTLSFKRELGHARRIANGDASHSSADTNGRVDLDEEVVLDAADYADAGDGSGSGASAAMASPGSTRPYMERRRSSRELLIPLRVTSAYGSTDTDEVVSTGDADADAAPARSSQADESVADKIITNLFSLFWSPPEPAAAGDVQTV